MSVAVSNDQPQGTYVTWVQDRSVLATNFGEGITLVEQEAMHIPNKTQILLVSGGLTDSLPPFLNRLQDAMLDSRGSHGGTFGEPSDQFIEKLFCADLEVEFVSAVLDANV